MEDEHIIIRQYLQSGILNENGRHRREVDGEIKYNTKNIIDDIIKNFPNIPLVVEYQKASSKDVKRQIKDVVIEILREILKPKDDDKPEKKKKRKSNKKKLGEYDEEGNHIGNLTSDKTERINIDEWKLPTDKLFPTFMKDTFADIVVDNKRKDSSLTPFRHQKYVSDYLSDNTPYRGLLLYHGLGSGKSGASIFIAEGMDRRVVVMLPASLRGNYQTEINKYAGQVANKHWIFYKTESILSLKDKNFFIKNGITEELYKMVTRKIKGIWLMDHNKDPNYNELDEKSQKQISDQLEMVKKYKYTILHTNAGRNTIIELIKLIDGYEDIYEAVLGNKSPNPSDITDANIQNILNYIYAEKKQNPFDNKLLIIDEVHNFTSQVIGNGKIAPRIYELIMRATNLKIVFLSGTPIINHSYEFAVMCNMLRGHINSYTISLEKEDEKILNKQKLKRILDGMSNIYRYNIGETSIEVVRTPIGFVRNKDGITSNGETVSDFITTTNNELRKEEYIVGDEVIHNSYSLFPDILTEKNPNKSMLGSSVQRRDSKLLFEELYIDTKELTVKKPINFQNRIMGLISFYNEISGTDEKTGFNLFPSKRNADADDTTVYMSWWQFIQYANKRRIERAKERLSTFKRDEATTVSQYFKVLSRQAGLFVFPPGIERPMKEYKTSVEDEDEDTVSTSESVNYEKRIQDAVAKLDEQNLTVNDDTFNLNVLSPKYSLMLKNMDNSPGLIFGYSQYRNAEGINVFARVLDYNGYSKFDPSTPSEIKIGSKVRYSVKDEEWHTYTVTSDVGDEYILDKNGTTLTVQKTDNIYACCYALWTGSESQEQRRIIFKHFVDEDNKFGQKCVILLATQAGSEGISLRHVQQVHIMEPYWNNVRIEQVIGRARRIRSHVLLPLNQQNVTVFNYTIKIKEGSSVFSDSDISEDGTLEKIMEASKIETKDAFMAEIKKLEREVKDLDDGLTSDEVLLQISENKTALQNDILTLIKQSSIDCNFNKDDNIKSGLPDIECYNEPITSKENDADNYNLLESSGKITKITPPIKIIKSVFTIAISIKVNGKTIKAILLDIPSDIYKEGDVENTINKLPENYPIHDYYIYKNLYPLFRSQENIQIGKLIRNKSGAYIPGDYADDFITQRLDEYVIIEDCIKQLEWTEHTDAKGRTYHYQKSTNKSQWKKPEKDDKWSEQIRECYEMKIGLPDGWTIHYDNKRNLPYYYNKSTKQTQWKKPQSICPICDEIEPCECDEDIKKEYQELLS